MPCMPVRPLVCAQAHATSPSWCYYDCYDTCQRVLQKILGDACGHGGWVRAKLIARREGGPGTGERRGRGEACIIPRVEKAFANRGRLREAHEPLASDSPGAPRYSHKSGANATNSWCFDDTPAIAGFTSRYKSMPALGSTVVAPLAKGHGHPQAGASTEVPEKVIDDNH